MGVGLSSERARKRICRELAARRTLAAISPELRPELDEKEEEEDIERDIGDRRFAVLLWSAIVSALKYTKHKNDAMYFLGLFFFFAPKEEDVSKRRGRVLKAVKFPSNNMS